ncbi:MAG: endonuclease/exonuclease/phosphatase family protein, partial [Actinobacteria bacterium]|nr:endonuclease/exonuclease/phosphatase family protein [Actinomycetota bacterium]
MRVLVWNVHGFRAGVDRVAEAAAGLEPDLALITECSTARRLHRFADVLGMSVHHGSLPPLLRRARDAVLIREPLRLESFESHGFRDSARWHPRGVAIARLSGGLTVAVTHLGLSGEERRRHGAELIEVLGDDVPVILGGDLNELPGRGATRMLSEHFEDAWTEEGGETFPARNPSSRIDYVFTRGMSVSGVWVPGGASLAAASDHLPLVV